MGKEKEYIILPFLPNMHMRVCRSSFCCDAIYPPTPTPNVAAQHIVSSDFLSVHSLQDHFTYSNDYYELSVWHHLEWTGDGKSFTTCLVQVQHRQQLLFRLSSILLEFILLGVVMIIAKLARAKTWYGMMRERMDSSKPGE